MSKKVIIISIIVLIFFAGSISAQTLPDAGLTPDSPFYFLDTLREKIGLFFTFGSEKKAEKALRYAEEKLAEAKLMAEKNKADISESATEAYQGYLDFANQETVEAKENGRDVEELATLITETTLKHQEVLVEVFEKVPEQAKTAIEKAIEVSRKGSERAVQSVSGAKKEELLQRIEEMEVRIEVLEGKVEEVEQEQETQGQSIEELQKEKGAVQAQQEAQEKAIEELEKEKKAVQAQLQKEKSCNDYNRIQAEIKDACGTLPYPGINYCIWYWQMEYSRDANPTASMLAEDTLTFHGVLPDVYWRREAEKYLQKVNKLKELKTQYLSAAQGCGISLEEENQKSQQFLLEYGLGVRETVPSKEEIPPTSPNISVVLAPDSPGEGGCVARGTNDTVLAKIKFTNNSPSVATITSINIIIAGNPPSALSEMKLYEETTQLGSTASVLGRTTFSNLNWTIPANSTKTLIIKASLRSAIAGIVKLGIWEPSDITASIITSGTFPVWGHYLSIADTCGG